MKTKDFVAADLIKKLQTLEGLTNDERSNLIGLLRQHKKYGLVWEDKPEDVEERLREELPVLREVKDKAIIGTPPDGEDGGGLPNHILIEGDNLEALTALSYTHEGKIDVIYIDPPYNTGNKDFVYNDSFVDSEDSYRHSKWLSFMNKRLKIAKKLLSDKGVIFISIDDNEQAQLKLLCDEIFGSYNFVAIFVWVKKKKGSHLSKTTRSMTEYVLCYAKNYSDLEMYGEAAYSDKQQPLAKRTNSQKNLSFASNIIHTTLSDGIYSGVQGKGSSALNFKEFEVKNNLVISPCVVSGPFIWTQSKLDEEIKMGTTINLSSKFGFNVLRSDQESKIKRPSTLIDNKIEVGTNEDAYDEIIEIFGEEGIMSYPKPVSLIKYLINTRAFFYKNLIILDFFAGSGTTLHATMQLNAEDGGHRQCILVTNNENNICEEVTYERNKRVIQGYTTPKGVKVEGLKQNTLRYYKTDFIPRDRTQKNMRALVAAATDLLCIKEDLYEEQKTFGRFMLKPHLARYFNDGLKHMLIIYHEELIDEIVEEIKSLPLTPSKGEGNLKIYVFSPGRYPFTDNFREVEDKVELVALPAAIYDAYQKVLPKRKEILFEEEKQETEFPSDLFEGQEEGGEA